MTKSVGRQVAYMPVDWFSSAKPERWSGRIRVELAYANWKARPLRLGEAIERDEDTIVVRIFSSFPFRSVTCAVYGNE